MNEFLIEREMPNVGQLTLNELKLASQTSCDVLRELGSDIQWVHSYVTSDKIYCLYRALNENLIRRHAVMAGFPASSVTRVSAIIDPTTAA